jgi:hypothetical protein
MNKKYLTAFRRARCHDADLRRAILLHGVCMAGNELSLDPRTQLSVRGKIA